MEASYISTESQEQDDVIPPEPREISQQLLWACEYGKYETVKEILIEDKSLVNTEDDDGYTPLHRAAYKNQVEIVKVLISSGANLDRKTIDGWTPLHSACHWGNVDSAKVLLLAGCDINAGTNSQQTPLHIAAYHRTPTTLPLLQLLLLSPGIKYNTKNKGGETPEDLAIRSGAYPGLFEITRPVLNCFNL